MAVRLRYFVSHPIQYQAPLLRLIARQPDIDLKVVFHSAAGSEEYYDEGFKQRIRWDVSLLDGYESEVVPHTAEALKRLEDCDVAWLHGWQGHRMRALLSHAKKRRIPVLMRGENSDTAMPDGAGLRGVAKRFYLNRIFSRCSAFLCIGSENRSYYVRHQVDPDRLFSMPYAIDNRLFSETVADSRSTDMLRDELGIPRQSPVVLFAGKLQARKHPLILVDAFRKLNRVDTANPFLLFVGDGEQSGSVKIAAEKDPHIMHLGFRNQSELPKFYDLADVFVLASSREPWGLAVNEAMACRCAIVVSDECGCAPDLVNDSIGRVVPAANAEHLASALSALLKNPDRLHDMGNAAYQRISEWDFEQNLAGLREALSSVLRTPQRA